MGYASLANLLPQAGLYACMFGGLVFWLFCSSRPTTISATSAISPLIGSTPGSISGGDPTRFAALAAGTATLVGVIAIIAWLVKAGSIINFISESVMIGFKCGVALVLASTQLPKLFGIPAGHGDFRENSGTFLKHLNETNLAALTVGGTALVVLVLGKIFLGLDERGVKLLGEVPLAARRGVRLAHCRRPGRRVGPQLCRSRRARPQGCRGRLAAARGRGLTRPRPDWRGQTGVPICLSALAFSAPHNSVVRSHHHHHHHHHHRRRQPGSTHQMS